MKTLKTIHGEVKLPLFMPDATYGSINSISFQDAEKTGVEAIVTTSLHLEIFAGSDYIQSLGGLHKFFNWDKPILTDSGGFQVYSLIHAGNIKENKVDDEGATFKNPLNGSLMKLTPETSQQIQFKVDSDIRTVLDEPTPNTMNGKELEKAVDRNTDWAKRSKEEFLKLHNLTTEQFDDLENNPRPLLFAVVQGGMDLELRKRSFEELAEIGFDGFNWGGWPVDENGKLIEEVGKLIPQMVPKDKFTYAMGVGTPDDIKTCCDWGWDLFDCVLPTRNARHGYLYTEMGRGDQDYNDFSVIHIKNESYKNNLDSIYPDSGIEELEQNALSYLRHLIRIKENSGFRIATMNNLYFYNEFLKSLRK